MSTFHISGDVPHVPPQFSLLMANFRIGHAQARTEAYHRICYIVDRDHQAGVDDHGIIDNILSELAKMAGTK